MTASDSQGPVEIKCDQCDHLFMSNLGVTVFANATTSPDGGPGPYLNFCSPQCSDDWHAANA